MAWLDAELLNDFAFNDGLPDCTDRRAAGRANTLAMLLTPFMRPLIGGITPLFLVQKAHTGEGASLLAGLPGMLSEGRSPDILRYTSNGEEFNKHLMAMVRGGCSHLYLDDVEDLNSKELHRNLTSPTISGRLLGTSKLISKTNNYNWVATGINPSVKEESARRTVNIRLNSENPEPGMRRFRHPDITDMTFNQFVSQNCGVAVAHILTLIEYWICKGKPIWTGKAFHGYTEWARSVGGVLNSCGVKGFLSQMPLTSHDPEALAQKAFVRSSVDKYGCDNAIPFADLLSLHQGIGSAIVKVAYGCDPADAFMKCLMRIHGRAFSVDAQKDQSSVVVVNVGADASGATCSFSKVRAA